MLNDKDNEPNAKVRPQKKTTKHQAPPGKKSSTSRNPDHRMLSVFVDKHVLHNVKVEAAKLNMNTTDFIRYIVDQALDDDDLKPPMKEL